MSKQKKSSADHVDTHRKLLFTSMALLSLIFGIKSVLYFVEGEAGSYLSIVAKVLAVISLTAIGVTIFWKLRFIPGRERYYLLTSPDSFVMQVMNRACRISWALTFALISLITMTTKRDYSPLPAEFYLNLASFCMLATFSISFFVLFRTEGDEEYLETEV